MHVQRYEISNGVTHHKSDVVSSHADCVTSLQKQNADFAPLFDRIKRALQRKKPIIIAIDGHCASGKSTLAHLLHCMYDSAVIQVDHFFLQAHMRTQNRLDEAGGNIDYERFLSEVYTPLLKGESFSYRPYCCNTQTFKDPIHIPKVDCLIVEGSYSMHPHFSQMYDLKVFLSLSVQCQLARLAIREDAMSYRQFIQRWIPLENRYFDTFSIAQACDLHFHFHE